MNDCRYWALTLSTGASPHGNQQRSSYAPSQDPFPRRFFEYWPHRHHPGRYEEPAIFIFYRRSTGLVLLLLVPRASHRGRPTQCRITKPPQSLRPDASQRGRSQGKEIATAGTPSTGPCIIFSCGFGIGARATDQPSKNRYLQPRSLNKRPGGSMGYGPPGFRDTASAGQTRDMRGGSPRAPSPRPASRRRSRV